MTGRKGVVQRFEIPADISPYRSIGPFGADSVPVGLLREHRLKEGTWARLTVLAGEVGFVWDDADMAGELTLVAAGETINVPPQIAHHLDLQGDNISFAIEFLSASGQHQG